MSFVDFYILCIIIQDSLNKLAPWGFGVLGFWGFGLGLGLGLGLGRVRVSTRVSNSREHGHAPG